MTRDKNTPISKRNLLEKLPSTTPSPAVSMVDFGKIRTWQEGTENNKQMKKKKLRSIH